MNIAAQSTSLPATVKEGVIPVESPSVASALIASNIRAMKGMSFPPSAFSVRVRVRVAAKWTSMNRTITVSARNTIAMGIRHPKTCDSSCPRSEVKTATATTPMVVSRTPPAVPPGAPPTSMIPTKTKSVAGETCEKSTVANPPLRAATLSKRAAMGLAQVGVLASEWPHSTAKKKIAPPTTSRPWISSTSLASRVRRLHRRRSAISCSTR